MRLQSVRLTKNTTSELSNKNREDESNTSRISGTNVSYMSSFSAIKNNIIRFKNKKTTKLTLLKQADPCTDEMDPILEPRRTATVTPRKLMVVNRPQVYSSIKKEGMNTLGSIKATSNPRGSLTNRTRMTSLQVAKPGSQMQALKKPANKPLKINIDLQTTQEKKKEAEVNIRSVTQPDFEDEIDEFRVSLVSTTQPVNKGG